MAYEYEIQISYILKLDKEKCIDLTNSKIGFNRDYDGKAYPWGFTFTKKPDMLSPILKERYKFTAKGLFIENDKQYLVVNVKVLNILGAFLAIWAFMSFAFIVGLRELPVFDFILGGCILVYWLNIINMIRAINDFSKKLEDLLDKPKKLT